MVIINTSETTAAVWTGLGLDIAAPFLFSHREREIILQLAHISSVLKNADPHELRSFSAYNIFEGVLSVPANADWFVFTVARDTFY